MMTLRTRAVAGFTIVELLVVLAILGVLAAAVMPLGESLLAAQKERELRQALWEIRGAIDDYRRTTDKLGSASTGSGYPPNLQALVEGLSDPRPEARGGRIYFLRRIPRDPFADPQLPPAETWRLRSYASPADQPRPGSDVYDVKSSSERTGLDGTRHDTW
jgi:general secretion pathway protein G